MHKSPPTKRMNCPFSARKFSLIFSSSPKTDSMMRIYHFSKFKIINWPIGIVEIPSKAVVLPFSLGKNYRSPPLKSTRPRTKTSRLPE